MPEDVRPAVGWGVLHLFCKLGPQVEPEAVVAAVRCGLADVGENRVQEAKAKWPALRERYPDVALHLVGPLQSNKARDAVALFDAIHTVDRPKIAAAIADEGWKTFVATCRPGVPQYEITARCEGVVRELGASTPILGVCLGHQAIGVAYGARVVRAPSVVHGKVGPVRHAGAGILAGLDKPFMATRYHSLVIAAGSLPLAFALNALTYLAFQIALFQLRQGYSITQIRLTGEGHVEGVAGLFTCEA